ncbi:hypothetical protein [Acinetobacter lactucae]|uniref:hypothetical protein n=1 Tax=Acinetobacter lactucae TaxID=1785128 RepID=UPI00157FD1A2|nr:hypothetical protein [Acinetobacter lactucae]NUF16962.1 hypothetical protein [Acinetobacter lactucae]
MPNFNNTQPDIIDINPKQTEKRSSDVLLQKVSSSNKLIDELKIDPLPTLIRLNNEVKDEYPINGVEKPSKEVNDVLWKIVILAFSGVMLITTISLCIGVFVDHDNIASGTVLAIFTSVVGFLAGLFSPSPLGRRTNTT